MDYLEELVQFEGYLDKYVQPGTVKVYIHALRNWFVWLHGLNPSKKLAQSYVDSLINKNSASTVSLKAHAIIRWFRWKGEHVELESPTVRIPEPKYLNTSEFEKYLDACVNTLEKTLAVVLFDTAARISELLGLKEKDIDWENGLIMVTGKGGGREGINISDKAQAILVDWLDERTFESEKVFGGLSYHDAWVTLKAVGKRIGIDFHPHMLRHSRAIQMLRSGATLHDVQQHLRHANIATTANIYGRFKPVDLKERIPAW